MVFGYSSKDKWKEDNRSCLEYIEVFHDLTTDFYIVVLDSDMKEFRNEYENELNDGIFVSCSERVLS